MERQIGVVVLPDARTDGFVRGLSRIMPESRLVLGDQDAAGGLPPHPHVSLLHLVVNDTDIGEFASTVLGDLPTLPRGSQRSSELHITSSGWCFLETPRTRLLLALQRHALKASDGFRARPVHVSWKDRFTPAQARAHARWGYPNIGSAWNPHFTFGRIANGEERQVRCHWIWWPLALAVVSLGQCGSATELLHIVHLDP